MDVELELRRPIETTRLLRTWLFHVVSLPHALVANWLCLEREAYDARAWEVQTGNSDQK